MLAEQQTEWIINNNLVNKGWHIDGDSNLKNVYFQKPPYPDQQRKLKGKKPDYILYQTGTSNPIAIIEAKKGGINLDPALEQGTEYAKALNVPLVFAMNGAYCETRFVPNNKELILNGEEVRGLVREKEALEFLSVNSNEAWTIPQEVKVSRDELVKIFKELNNTLRGEGLRAGIERFSEFSNILFLKLLSENEQTSHWDFIKTLPDDRLISTINGSIIKEIENKYGGNVFTPISIQNPSTLRKIINRIDPLVLSTIDTDIKGDAFEYFLKQTTSTNNDLGEYFTPRHIIKTAVDLAAPKFKEKVYDPFCGTGGFLTEAFNYIKDNNIIEDKEDRKRLKDETLHGGEITTTARIAKMNMILHGDGHSGVKQIDSLGNPIEGLYDVVVTNIPFSQTTEYGSLYYNGISKKRGDAVCVLHCLNALKEGGRMALIVPEGFLFRKDIAKVREFLLSKAKLQTVISLPQGAFLPYTGVKTDILYFTNAHKLNNQKSYWYFDVRNDGYSLDNHRRQLKGRSDLHKVAESDFKKVEKDSSLKENVLEIGFEVVNIEKVKQNNYNLVGSVYRKTKTQDTNIQLFSSLLESGLIVGKKGKTITNATAIEGNIPVIAGGQSSPYSHNESNYGGNIITISASGAYSGFIWYHSYHIWASDCSVVYSSNEKVLITEYLSYVLKTQQEKIYEKQHGSGQPHVYLRDLNNIEIPSLSIEKQQKIVDELNSCQKIIKGAKQIVENWGPTIDINTSWEMIKLGDMAITEYGTSRKSQEKGKYAVLRMGNLQKGEIDFTNLLYSDADEDFAKLKLVKGDVLFNRTNSPELVGKASIFRGHALPMIFAGYLVRVTVDRLKIIPEYLNVILNSPYGQELNNKYVSISGNQANINATKLKSYPIPTPPLEIQKQIIGQLEAERKMIEYQKEVIKAFEEKIKNRLNGLWQAEEEKTEPVADKQLY